MRTTSCLLSTSNCCMHFFTLDWFSRKYCMLSGSGSCSLQAETAAVSELISNMCWARLQLCRNASQSWTSSSVWPLHWHLARLLCTPHTCTVRLRAECAVSGTSKYKHTAPVGSVVHTAVRGLQQRKGADFVLEGLQQLHSFVKLLLVTFLLPVNLHNRQQCSCCFWTWQKGNTTEQYNKLDEYVHCTKHNWQDFGCDALQARQEQVNIVWARSALAMDVLPREGRGEPGSSAVCIVYAVTLHACCQPMFDLDGDILHYMNGSSLSI